MRISPYFAGVKPKVVCVGSLMVDNIGTPKLDDLPKNPTTGQPDLNNLRGAKLPAIGPIVREMGGGAANVCINFTNLGMTAMPLGRIANDQKGRWLKNQLTKLGIDQSLLQEQQIPKPKSLTHRFLLKVEGALRYLEHAVEKATGKDIPGFLLVSNEFEDNDEMSTGQSLVINFPTDRTVLTHRGVSNKLQLKDVNWKALSQANGLYISNFGSDDKQFLETMVTEAKKRNPKIMIAFNPGKGHLKNGLEQHKTVFPLLDVLNLNMEEARELSGLEQSAPVEAQLARLKAAGPKLVLITDGKRGAYTFDGSKMLHMPTYPVKVASTLGAGDAFGSTFMAYMMDDPANPAKALQYASANAASVVQKIGASKGIRDRQELDEFVAQYKISHPDVAPKVYGSAGATPQQVA